MMILLCKTIKWTRVHLQNIMSCGHVSTKKYLHFFTQKLSHFSTPKIVTNIRRTKCCTQKDARIIRLKRHFVPKIFKTIEFYTHKMLYHGTNYKPFKHGSVGFCDTVVAITLGTTLYPACKYALLFYAKTESFFAPNLSRIKE